MWNSSTYDCDRDKAYKIGAYLEIKNCLCKKRFFGKLVQTFKDGILNTTENTSIVDKKVTYKKNYCFIHTISLVIICLFLVMPIFTIHFLIRPFLLNYGIQFPCRVIIYINIQM